MKEQLLIYGDVIEEASLKQYNTFHIASTCKYLVFPKSISDVQGLISFLQKEKLRYFILGNGSNIIFLNDYYDGVMVSLKQLNHMVFSDDEVLVGAGVMMPTLAMEVIRHGFSGFEWASGIPGTVGGSIYGNAEAYKESTFDFLKQVTILEHGVVKTVFKDDLHYAYRTSTFKEHPGAIILEAVFTLKEGNQEESFEKMKKRKERRMETQPLEYPSAGSVFRNPSSENPSGRIIEELGLKGVQIHDAKISEKHANFIVNVGSATGKDIQSLIELIHSKVLEHRNIDLLMEQEYVGWDEDEGANQ